MLLGGILCILLINIYICLKRKEYFIWTPIIIFIILIVGLRYDYAYDYNNYYIHFNEINNIKDVFNSIYEVGYSFSAFLFRKIGFGFNTFLLAIATFSISIKLYVMKKVSPMPCVSFLVYFLVFFVYNDVTQIRHGLALAFCFFSVLFIEKNRNIYFSLVVVAALFHYSAIVFILTYFFKNILINKKRFILIILISCVFSSVDIFGLIKIINDNFIHSFYLAEKIALYITDTRISLSFFIGFGLRILFSYYYLSRVLDTSNKIENQWFTIYNLGIIVYCALSSNITLQGRLSIYFNYSEIILFGYCFYRYLNTRKKMDLFLLIFFFGYFLAKFLLVIIEPQYFFYQSI